jgi:hypothetical protein
MELDCQADADLLALNANFFSLVVGVVVFLPM